MNPDSMFLAYAPEFCNYHLYVVKDTLLWIININDGKIPRTPKKIVNYLPKVLSNISHVFQNTLSTNLLVIGTLL